MLFYIINLLKLRKKATVITEISLPPTVVPDFIWTYTLYNDIVLRRGCIFKLRLKSSNSLNHKVKCLYFEQIICQCNSYKWRPLFRLWRCLQTFSDKNSFLGKICGLISPKRLSHSMTVREGHGAHFRLDITELNSSMW